MECRLLLPSHLCEFYRLCTTVCELLLGQQNAAWSPDSTAVVISIKTYLLVFESYL